MGTTTAEDFLLSHRFYDGSLTQSQEEDFMVIMREFAEMHRKEALTQAKEKARVQKITDPDGGTYHIVNKDSVLNAYSKKHIT